MPGDVAGRGAIQSHRYAGFENGDDDSDDDDDLSGAFDTVRVSLRNPATTLIRAPLSCLLSSGAGLPRGPTLALLQPMRLRMRRPRCCACVFCVASTPSL